MAPDGNVRDVHRTLIQRGLTSDVNSAKRNSRLIVDSLVAHVHHAVSRRERSVADLL
jgi:hypothetical protein